MAEPIDLSDTESVIELMDRAAEALRGARYRHGSGVVLPSRGGLIATGDLHDNPFHLQKIVGLARLDAAPSNHVVLHEMIHGERLVNGMDFSYRMLVRVAALVDSHPDQVHPVLANHELAQMTGRGVSKGAGNSVELFRDALEYVFGEHCEEVADAVNGFIRAMPLAVRSENGVLCAHSLPAEAMMKHFDVDVLDRDLSEDDYQAPHGAAHLMTWGRRYTDTQVDELAERWQVKTFCLGHEHAETGIEVRGPRVVVLNSDHERATVLPIDLSDVPDAGETILLAMPLSAIG